MLIAPEQIRQAPERSNMTVPDRFNISFEATELGVRRALAELLAWLSAIDGSADLSGRVEIVLAEALNNVVEHAYAMSGKGQVELRCNPMPDRLDFTILDQGCAVPVHVFAQRSVPDTDVPLEDLPEGGFGWLLIQTMTRSLSYQRVQDTNCLRMAIPLDPVS